MEEDGEDEEIKLFNTGNSLKSSLISESPKMSAAKIVIDEFKIGVSEIVDMRIKIKKQLSKDS